MKRNSWESIIFGKISVPWRVVGAESLDRFNLA